MMCCQGHRPNGDPCRRPKDLNARGYCHQHSWQDGPRCQGIKGGTTRPCKKPAKEGYAYCCATHDPAEVHIPPSVLDPEGYYLRGRVQDDVVARWKEQDIYNRRPLDLRSLLDLDHIVEKQCFTYGLSQLDLRQGDDDFALATEVLRENVVNELDNLTLTRSSTNRIKGAGVYQFLDDSRTGHLGNKTFTTYLLEATRDGETLGRVVTRRITRNMGRAMKKCQWKLSDEGDTPVLDNLSGQLQKLFVAMELHER
ncbi:hypothetical protein F443_04606 [Phytophthora nicotianae P1569]|uniref:Uncharacterized protein n=1 Tax=Phytophthora nicotianae P1569 TaxID=1317065 RepID=V9FP41_PHYNI|nr:hypothetical protein F443_04606 [Phytophthora nicotianae P1569]